MGVSEEIASGPEMKTQPESKPAVVFNGVQGLRKEGKKYSIISSRLGFEGDQMPEFLRGERRLSDAVVSRSVQGRVRHA